MLILVAWVSCVGFSYSREPGVYRRRFPGRGTVIWVARQVRTPE